MQWVVSIYRTNERQSSTHRSLTRVTITPPRFTSRTDIFIQRSLASFHPGAGGRQAGGTGCTRWVPLTGRSGLCEDDRGDVGRDGACGSDFTVTSIAPAEAGTVLAGDKDGTASATGSVFTCDPASDVDRDRDRDEVYTGGGGGSMSWCVVSGGGTEFKSVGEEASSRFTDNVMRSEGAGEGVATLGTSSDLGGVAKLGEDAE